MSAVATPHPVLVESVPGVRALARPGAGRWAREAALIGAGVVAVTLISQIAVPLPFTPVPLTLGTFGALLVGAALGPVRGLASLGAYAMLGAVGAPVLAGWSTGGLAVASFGYVVGYALAGTALGWAARRGADRSMLGTATAAVGATMLVYVAGVPWLMLATGADLRAGLEMGMVPFLIGDAIKAVAAAALLPTAWRLIDRTR